MDTRKEMDEKKLPDESKPAKAVKKVKKAAEETKEANEETLPEIEAVKEAETLPEETEMTTEEMERILSGLREAEAQAEKAKAAKKKKRKKKVKVVLLCLLGLVLILAATIAGYASKNVKEMNACVDETVSAIVQDHKLCLVDTGEFSEMSAYGILKFHIQQYELLEVGNLSVMTVNAGVMQMATVVFSPFDKDLPLMSCDYMYMLSTRKAYVEFYDLVAEKDADYMEWMERYEALRGNYGDLTDVTAASGWYDSLITVAIYKSASPKQDERIRGLLHDAVTLYLEQADESPALSESERNGKVDRIKEYSDRLIDEGGVSTSFFKQALGEDVTRRFFDQVFFGTAKAR